MKNFLLMLIGISLIASWLTAGTFFHPEAFRHEPGMWYATDGVFKGEQYDNYIYQGEIVFRILGRFVPLFSCYLVEAKRIEGTLHLKHTTDGFFNSAHSIKESFSIQKKQIIKPRNHNIVVIDSSTLELIKKERLFGSEDCYMQCDKKSNQHYKISKAVFDLMNLTKTLASTNEQFLEIDLTELSKENCDATKCVSLVPKVSRSSECCVCQDKPKDILIEPCNHVCLCESCSIDITDTCPLCRQKITKKKKIYL